MIEFLKKYKTQIFNIITIFLILEFVIYPALTKADTISNIFAAIGLLLLIVWGGLTLYYYVKGNESTLTDEQIKTKLESELGPVIDEMAKEVLAKPKRKSNPKQFDGVKSDEPFVKTRTKAKTEKVLGEFQINNKEKVRKSVTKKVK
jgi:hypothetical protein